MPTPNGLWTPVEVNDELLKAAGVDGYIDPVTKLLLPHSKESERIIAQRVEDGIARPDRYNSPTITKQSSSLRSSSAGLPRVQD
jgi:hypothetical protein